MNLINNKYVVIEKKKDFDSFALYLVKDKKSNQFYYLVFQIQNNLLINNFNIYLDFIIDSKKNPNPAIINPIELVYVHSLDDIKVESTAFFLLYHYEEKKLLEDYIKEYPDKESEILDKILDLNNWFIQSGYDKYSYENSIILIDKQAKPYFIPVFILNPEESFFESQLHQIEQHIKNKQRKNDGLKILKDDINNFFFSYFEDNNSLNNCLYFLAEYIFQKKLNFFDEKFNNPSFEKPIFYNLMNFPTAFSSYVEEYLSILSKDGFFNFLNLSASPDKYSLINNAIDKITEKYIVETEFLNIKPELIAEDISIKKHSILDSILMLSINKPLIIQINNFNVADIESIKLINSLIQLKNLHFPIVIITFDMINGVELECKINYLDFAYEKDLAVLLKNTIINYFKELFNFDKSDLDFLNTLDLQVLLSFFSGNLISILSNRDGIITLKKDLIKNSIKNELDFLIHTILINEETRLFFLYFLHFEKPIPLKFLYEIFEKKLDVIISKFIKTKLIYIDENNRLNSNLISTMRLIFSEIVKTKYDRKNIIEKISDIYLKNIEEININEIFLCFRYLCELKKLENAAFLVDNKILLPLNSNQQTIKKLFFGFLQNYFNYGKNIDLIKDIYTKLIFKLLYFKLKYIDNDKKFEEIIQILYEESKNQVFGYRFILEKILFYIKIHNTEKIEKDIGLIEKNFENLPLKYKKLFLYAKAEDYFSRYDHKNAIKTAKEAIKTIDLSDNFDKSLYLPIMHRMVNSIIYSSSYSKANGYLKYFLKKALELKDIRYIYYAYNNLGVVNYRNKEFEKARNYMINAFEYASQIKDKTLMFISYNNLNLFEMDRHVRISRSKKMLTLAPFLAEKTYLILSFCNIFLYLFEEGNFEEIFNLVLKYKNEIFQNFDTYSQFTIRRFIHLYTVLAFPFYLFDKIKYLKIFIKNLQAISSKMEKEDDKSEIKNLYNIIYPILKYLVLTLEDKREIDEENNLKTKIKNIFLDYSSDKDKIANTEFFHSLIGIYGLLFFNEAEFESLIGNMVNKYGKDPKICNPDLTIYYRIKSTKQFSDSVFIKYIEKYFKLFDIDPWSSSGIYFKSFILLSFLKYLKKSKNIEKFKLYLLIFYTRFNSFYKYVNSNKLFFQYLKKEFNEIFSLLSYEKNFDEYSVKYYKEYSFSSNNLIRLPKDEYDKDYFKKILIEISNLFYFDRAILYIYENKEMKIKEKICKEPILYYESEPSYPFLPKDFNYPKEPVYKKLKNSNIAEMLYIPIYHVNAISRIFTWERHNRNKDKYYLLRGYIYLDSKIKKNRYLNPSALDFCSLYISELFERIQIEMIYMHDYLTKVLTRENFYKKCNQIINLNRQTAINAFFMIDIDNFKKINDTFGHQKGDIILSKIASTIKNSLRSIDIVGRYGGEEFTVCLPDTSSDNAFLIAERLRTNIENSNYLLNNYKVTVSIGISLFPQDGIILDELINKADSAMYRAKTNGKNRTEIY